MREVWLMQPRFERRTVNSARALIAQPRFRAGYDFLRLRADVGEVDSELADWWEDFHLGDEDEREALLQDVKAKQAAEQRRRGPAPAANPPAGERHHAPHDHASHDDTEDDAGDAAAPLAAETAAPRKRRRRRRRPASGGAAPMAE
jgi:poly(A) polymerase